MIKEKFPLLVFDLDGTLAIFKPKVSPLWLALQQIAPEKAAEKDARTRIAAIPKGGRLDTDIVLDVLEQFRLGQEDLSQYKQAFINIYVEKMPQTPVHLCGAIKEVLFAARERDLSMAILTGNFEATALAKLQRANLYEFFQIGAYGDEQNRRVDLLPYLLKKMGRNYNAKSLRQTIIIGDTPFDLEVARTHGAHAVAVAEGPYSASDLAFYEPDLLLERWSGREDLEKILQLTS